MTLSEFKKQPIDWQVKYDFTNDTQDNLGANQLRMSTISNPIRRYFVYKCGKIEVASLAYLEYDKVKPLCNFINYATQYNHPGDPDGSSRLLQEIYQELFSDVVENTEIKKQGAMGKTETRFTCSDTMTSATNFVNTAFAALYCSDDGIRKDFESIFKSTYNDYFGPHPGQESKKFSIFSTTAIVSNNGVTDAYRRVQRSFPNLRKFLDVYHTIGNFCPVPSGFNGARSGGEKTQYVYYKITDFWDLTLMKIKEWYDVDARERAGVISAETSRTKKTKILEDLLKTGKPEMRKTAISNTQAWLESLGGWDAFVEKNFFHDFVHYNHKARCWGAPKRFWPLHDWKQTDVPAANLDRIEKVKHGAEMAKLNAALGRVARMIKKRGERMMMALSEK